MNKDKALKLALEALDDLSHYADLCELFLKETHPGKAESLRKRVTNSIKAITAIKEALAQPEQEPVAVKTLSKIGKAVGYWRADLVPPHIGPDSHDITPLYTTPPQRKPLTDEEINEFFQGMEPNNGFWLSFARAIEAAHGIKGKA